MWTFSWLVYSDVTGFSRYAFTDSLMFVTAPSSAWDQGQLFCLNKRTGALKWTNELDTIGWSSDAGGLYFSLPVVSNGKVIVVTRDYNKHRRLVAYNVLTGKKVWGTGINDDLKFNIKVDNGKIYSVGKTTFCYDANTGAQLWQKDINIIYTSSAIENGALVLNNSAAYVGPLSYIDQNKLIIAGKDSLFSAVTNVKVLDKNTGAILSSQVYNLEFAYYMYGDNTIYIGNYVSGFFLNAYDLNTGAFKWKYATTVSYPPILTDKNIIYSKREGTYFLNLDGKMVRLLPHPAPSTYVDVYLFKDASNNVFTQRIN
jgi:outer membrane protein assembly factor BamB